MVFISSCLSSRSSAWEDTGFITALPLPSSSTSSAGVGHRLYGPSGFCFGVDASSASLKLGKKGGNQDFFISQSAYNFCFTDFQEEKKPWAHSKLLYLWPTLPLQSCSNIHPKMYPAAGAIWDHAMCWVHFGNFSSQLIYGQCFPHTENLSA